jgi:hypothetical protein
MSLEASHKWGLGKPACEKAESSAVWTLLLLALTMNDHPLPTLRNQLLNLHKLLMNAERAAYEREVEVIRSPLHFLQLLTEHERFAWLRQLSQLVVMMDEAMEEKPPITPDRADALVQEATHLLTGSVEPESFAVRYAAIRERETELASAHAELSKCFDKTLPGSME